MEVIILCGGLGTRLKEETEFKPKPMVLVGGKPIIWHIMKIYATQGFNEFILALGYKADYIKDFFLNQNALTTDFTINTKTNETIFHSNGNKDVDDFKITFVDTGLETLIGERILKCKKYIPDTDDHFMVTYGDGVSNLNVKKLVKFHMQSKTIATISGVHPRSKYGLIQVNKKGLVSNFLEKPVLKDWVNGGYMVCNKKIFSSLRKNENEHPALRRLAKKGLLSLYKHNGFWFSVDTFKELDDLNTIWNSGKAPWKIWQ